MSNEQQPRRSAPKKVLEFPEEKRVQALPSPEVPESSIEHLPRNVFSLEEKRKATERDAKLRELRTDLRDLPGDEDGEYEADEHLDDQFFVLKNAFFKEMMYAGIPQNVSQRMFDSMALHILSYEETSPEDMDRLQSMTADERDEFFQDQWNDLRARYHQSFPNARPNFIPALPQKSTPPHSLFQRFDEWSKKLFGFLWKG